MKDFLYSMRYTLAIAFLVGIATGVLTKAYAEEINLEITYKAPETRTYGKPLLESEIAGYIVAARDLCDTSLICDWVEFDAGVSTTYLMNSYVMTPGAAGVEIKVLTMDHIGQKGPWSESVEYLHVYPPAKQEKPTIVVINISVVINTP